MRVIENRFPGQSGFAETAHVAIDIADLLSVAIGAAVLPVYSASTLLGGGESERMGGRGGADLVLQDATRPDAEQQDRHAEEADASDASDEIRHADEALH